MTDLDETAALIRQMYFDFTGQLHGPWETTYPEAQDCWRKIVTAARGQAGGDFPKENGPKATGEGETGMVSYEDQLAVVRAALDEMLALDGKPLLTPTINRATAWHILDRLNASKQTHGGG